MKIHSIISLLIALYALVTSVLLQSSGAFAAGADPTSTGLPQWSGYAIGGKNGRIVRVTSLASSGPGSLREALNVEHPRIVVFEVGGVIDLEMQGLRITAPA